MARKNSEVNPLVKQLIEENKIKSADDAQDFMKNMFKDMVNILMQAEFDESIGYDKYTENQMLILLTVEMNIILSKLIPLLEKFRLIFLEIERDSLKQRLFLNILEISLILKIKLSLCMGVE